MKKVSLGIAVLLWCVSAAWAGGDDVGKKFDSFCAEWMKKLEVREHDNRAAIQWKAGPDGVQGDFIGYSREHRCQFKPPSAPKATPIGRIVYTEVLYRQTGKSTAEAIAAQPRALEATEVTEIFRYSEGKWLY